jgi:hypothetical protein
VASTTLSAAPDASKHFIVFGSTRFSDAVMVLEPSMDVFKDMWRKTIDSFSCASECFLNGYFGQKWSGDAVLDSHFNTLSSQESTQGFDLAAVSILRNADNKPWTDQTDSRYPESQAAFWAAFSFFQRHCDESVAQVAFRSHRSGKVCVDQFGGIKCNSDDVTQEAIFALVPIEAGETYRFTLRSDRTGNYCNAVVGGVRCDLDVSHAGLFELWDMDWGLYSLRSVTGEDQYCSDDKGTLVCNRDKALEWELFQVLITKFAATGPITAVALQSSRERSFCATQDGAVKCNQHQIGIGASTRFDIVPAGEGQEQFFIRSLDGNKYCADMQEGIHCNYDKPQLFRFTEIGSGRFGIVGGQWQDFCSDVGLGVWRKIRCNRGAAQKLEYFELVLAGLPGSSGPRRESLQRPNSRLSRLEALWSGKILGMVTPDVVETSKA